MQVIVTVAQFVAEFLKLNAAGHIATFTTATRPKLNKKNRITGEVCPYVNGVEHRAIRTVQLAVSYKNCVNAQRGREGLETDFTPQGLWVSKAYPYGAGERVDALTVRHKGTGQVYFAYRCVTKEFLDQNGIKYHFPVVNESYWVDLTTGEVVDIELLKPYLQETKPDSGRQETAKKIFWQTTKVENVQQINAEGKQFILVG